MHGFKYAIWDFDGTLFNTYPHIILIIREIIRNKYKVDLSENQLREWCEISLTFCFEKIASKYSISKKELEEQFKKNYRINLEPQQPPFSGAKETLQYIKKGGGRNFIVTHRGSNTLHQLLSYYNMEYLFEKIITYEDDFPNKPNPASFLYLINEFKLPKESVIAIGDRIIDIQTANKINIKSCYFNPSGKTYKLADFNIRDLLELKGILKF